MHRPSRWRSGGSERLLHVERGNDTPIAAAARERARNSPTNLSMENMEFPNRAPRPSSFGRDSLQTIDSIDLSPGSMMIRSIDVSDKILDFSLPQPSPMDTWGRQSAVSSELDSENTKNCPFIIIQYIPSYLTMSCWFIAARCRSWDEKIEARTEANHGHV